jgi:hypothetical protein
LRVYVAFGRFVNVVVYGGAVFVSTSVVPLKNSTLETVPVESVAVAVRTMFAGAPAYELLAGAVIVTTGAAFATTVMLTVADVVLPEES